MAAFGRRKVIRELCEITSSKRIYAADYRSEGVPFYRGKEIIEKQKGDLEVSTELFISESKFSEIEAKFGAPQPGDLLLTSVGTLGVPYVVKSGEVFYFKDGNLTWFRNFTGLDSKFLYYWILSPLGRAQLKKATIGSSQSAFTIVLLKDLEIVLPSVPTQRKIAAILSAYDDLIENNTRRIKILEEMAQMLYRDWFVNFRFRGHENLRMVKTRLGQVPEGWEVKQIGELFSYNIGGGWGEEEQSDDFPIPAYVIRGTDIPEARYVNTQGCPLRYHKESNFNSRRLEVGDIVFEVSGGGKEAPVGRPLLISQQILGSFDNDAICASFCKLFRVDKEQILPEMIYLHLLDLNHSPRIEKYQVQSTGIKNFKFAFFLENEFVVAPTRTWIDKFGEFALPLFEQIQTLGERNVNLRRTRDLLLPKLISGEVDVSELEITVANPEG